VDTDLDHTGKLLLIQLTTARWHLDRVPSLDAEEARHNIGRAREICDEVGRCFMTMHVGNEAHPQLVTMLDDLRARLAAVDQM